MRFLILLLIAFTVNVRAQVVLDTTDIKHLLSLGRIFFIHSNPLGQEYIDTVEKHRTPALSHIVDVLQANARRDTAIIARHILTRPDDKELQIWYALRNVCSYSWATIEDVQKELAKKINTYELLDHYYWTVSYGVGYIFNENTLNGYNFNTKSYQLRDTIEEGIFYLNMVDALLGGRVQFLNYRGKHIDRAKYDSLIISFYNKMPTFNGNPFYYYTYFGNVNFDWNFTTKPSVYDQHYMDSFYRTLIILYNAIEAVKGEGAGLDIYNNSLLSSTQYFKYSKSKKELKKQYKIMSKISYSSKNPKSK